jgi:hypothetical protein
LPARAAYVAYVHGTLELLPPADKIGLSNPHLRLDIIQELWSTHSANRFNELMNATGATDLVEFSDHPLNIGPHRFLRPVWESPAGRRRVRILQYISQFQAGLAPATTDTTQYSIQGSGS